MSSVFPNRRELLALLDRLCEQRLTADEQQQLQAWVMGDDDALRLYLDYVTLHGLLHWDTAVGDAPGSAAVAPTPLPLDGRRRPRWTVIAMSATAALIAVAVLWIVPRAESPLGNGPGAGQMVADSPSSGDSGGSNGSATSPEAPPMVAPPVVVRLGSGGNTDSGTEHETPGGAAVVEPAGDASGASRAEIVAFIDAELSAGWAASELVPSPVADDGEWLRRAALDLAGRIPDIETVNAFLNDTHPDKREQFVSGLLRHGDFAEHLTTVWANLLVGRSPTTAHERRGLERFLRAQFRENRPWNEVVGELIAAEGSVEENGAAGFLLAHLNNEAVPATAITARLFLGEQVQCTQCHKHPWNEESQEVFWRLNAFFQQTGIERSMVADSSTGAERPARALVTRAVGGPTYYENLRGVMQVAYPEYGGDAIDPGAGVNRRRELARLLSDEDGHQLARAFVNRLWGQFFGYAFVNPVDDMGPHQAATHPELLDRLAREFAAGGYNVNELVRWITSSRAYQLSSRMEDGNRADDPTVGDPPRFSRMYPKPLSPEQLFNSLLVATEAGSEGRVFDGAVTQRREAWVQQFVAVLENEENGEVALFDGTLPQALAMMNGPLVQTALSGEPGTVLHELLHRRGNDAELLRALCLAALTREPTERERNLFVRHLRQAPSRAAKVDACRDILWAYLNSSEFVTNH